ncbi:MAG: hypothetical protein V7L23_37075, partial [Nostoc sp.]|uniref:hypothetical protein n=1 Tax=Nostoc sp. TaxID=1180 RepID=UPI002FF17EBC
MTAIFTLIFRFSDCDRSLCRYKKTLQNKDWLFLKFWLHTCITLPGFLTNAQSLCLCRGAGEQGSRGAGEQGSRG